MSACVCGCCGKEYGLPLKLTVLSEGPEATYTACPFCFSRVEGAEAKVVGSFVEKKHTKLHRDGDVRGVKAGAGSCSHHLGYLKERAKNATVPDECLICPKILQCMI